MAVTARILLVDPEAGRRESFSALVAQKGYVTIGVPGEAALWPALEDDGPDLIAIEVDGDLAAALKLVGEVRRDERAAAAPLVLLGDATGADITAKAFSSGIDDFLTRPYLPARLFRRLETLVRLATMRKELTRRSDTTERYGLDGPPAVQLPSEVQDARVLYTGPMGDADVELGRAISGFASLAVDSDPDMALDQLERFGFDALIISTSIGHDALISLLRHVRLNARLFNLPVAVLANHDEVVDFDGLFQAGASDVLHRPLEPKELRVRLTSLVRQQRFRLALQRVYREARHLATSDALTGLYNHGFLFDHLTRLVLESHKWGKILAVAYFRVTDLAAVNAEHGYAAGDRMLRQIGGVFSGLVRGEDLPARLDGAGFVVVMPDTGRDSAEIVKNRIVSVATSSEYLISDFGVRVRPDIRAGLAMLEAGDNAEVLVARAAAAAKG